MASALPGIGTLPSVADVKRITRLSDPVIRNLQITQCYHELALAMTARTGVSANWCTFATWASKQAGQTIRREDFSRLFEDIARTAAFSIQSAPDVIAAAHALGSTQAEAEIQESVWEVLNPLAALARAGDAVARGNKKVFEEIGNEFARFLSLCLNDLAFDPDKLARFCEALHPGDPPDGQQYLRQAFTHYYQAFFEADAKARAELMLLANIEIGLHEQVRLQPEIGEAMGAAFLDRRQFRARLIRALFPYRGWFARLRLFFLLLFDRPSPLDEILDRLVLEARRQAHLVITEYLMTITLAGDRRLRLGSDVSGEFPPSLKEIALVELNSLLEKIDLTSNSTRGTGAADWAHLPERLHFIVDMFRCYQETAALFDAPFTAAQVTDIRAGRLPAGRL